jgi:hypothetical protein
MITYKINQMQLSELTRELRRLGRVISDPKLQLYRAREFKRYTVKTLATGGVDIKKNSRATKKIQEKEHPPLYNTGNMARNMRVRRIPGNAAEAGFFENSREIPGKKITYTQAAILAHTGFKIYLKGEKGMRARRWLEWKLGIRFPSGKEYVIVPARPFLMRSYLQYMLGNEDVKAVDRFISKKLQGLSINV